MRNPAPARGSGCEPATGRLFRSEDHGASWDRPELEGDVAAFAIDRSGGVGALLVKPGLCDFRPLHRWRSSLAGG